MRDILQVTVAGLGVTMLLVGMPILLWSAAHTLHFPTAVNWFHLDQNVQAPPLSEQLSNWLYHTYHALRLGLGTDGLVVVVLLVVAGLAWLGLVWLVLVELALLARDGTELLIDRARNAGPRGWIASLLATLALSTTANVADAAPAAPTTAATAPPHPGTPSHADNETDTASAATTLGGHEDPPPTRPTTHLPDKLRPDCPRYRVHAGDTLTRIAGQHLGGPARWRELAELNQPWLPNPNQLAPGWQLLLPPDTPAPEQSEVTEITVTRGDTLASLAAHHLDDPERAGELYNLNASRTQPDGLQLADPDIVLPGWVLLVPTNAHETVPEQDLPVAGSPEEPAPGASFTPDAVPPASVTNNDGIWTGQGTFLGFGLAAAISLALAIARARHRRHHRPGNDLPDLALAPTVLQLRWAHLRATHAPDTADRPSTAETSVVPPAVSPDADGGPHAAASTGLRLDVGVHEGHTSTIDLAAQAGLALTGPASEPVARALLLHLLARHSSSTAAAVQIVLTRPDAELLLGTSEHPPTTVRVVDELPTALDLLEHARHDPHTVHQDAPLVLVTRAPTEHAHRLHRLLQPLTARTPGAILLGPWPEGTTLSTDAEAHVTHTQPDNADALQGTRLFTATLAAARDLLPLTPTPAGQAPSSEANLDTFETTPEQQAGYDAPLHATADRPPPHREPTAPAVAVTLRVFGPMSVIVTDNAGHSHELTPSLTSRQRELLAYLAIHPDGVARDTLITDLWQDPTRNRPTNALNTLLSRLRNTLWQASYGAVSDLVDVDTASHHRYRLNPQLVTTDYAQFQHRDSTSHHSSDTSQRLAALDELVETYTGPLAGDIDTEWIQAPRYQAQRSFINAISTLAHHRHTEAPEHTLNLLESALHHDPYNEFLYRDIMRLHHQLGMPHSISHTLQTLTTRLADIDAEPTTETTTLAHQLRHHDPHQHPRSPPT